MTIGMGMEWAIGGLLAAVRVASGPAYNIGLVVVVVVMIIALVGFYRVWSEVREEEEPDSPEELLEGFREAHAAGQIDDRELERVSALLSPGAAGEKLPRARKPIIGPDAETPGGDPGPTPSGKPGPPSP